MTKHAQIIALLEQGLTPQEVASKIGCRDAYVRACRAREWGNGRQYDNDYKRRAYRAGLALPGGREAGRQAYREAKGTGVSPSGCYRTAIIKYGVHNSTPRP